MSTRPHPLEAAILQASAAIARDVADMAAGRYTGRHCDALLNSGRRSLESDDQNPSPGEGP